MERLSYELSTPGRGLKELTTSDTVSCPPWRFQCANRECISLDRRCDGAVDCADSSDESLAHAGCIGFQKQLEGVICVSIGAFALVIIVALTVYWLGVHHRHRRREPDSEPVLQGQTAGSYHQVSETTHAAEGEEGGSGAQGRGLPSYLEVLAEGGLDVEERPMGSHHPGCNSRQRGGRGERRCNCGLFNPIEPTRVEKTHPVPHSEAPADEICIQNPFFAEWIRDQEVARASTRSIEESEHCEFHYDTTDGARSGEGANYAETFASGSSQMPGTSGLMAANAGETDLLSATRL